MKHSKVDGTIFGGKNIKKLNTVCKTKGYLIKIWGTYQQWILEGRFVQYGEKGSVVFGKRKNKDKFFRYVVFNIEQTRNLESII